MLTIDEALGRCLGAVLPVRAEPAALTEALGRVLAEDVHSPLDLPAWSNSAMDGFAVRSADAGAEGGVVLEVLETIAAGSVATRNVGPGQATRIMTGAPLPEGADAVVMFEDTETAGTGQVRLRVATRPGENVRRRGEDIRRGARVLEAGRTLGPAHLGLCAALGLTEVPCARRPTVALVSTGDEVVPPGLPLGPGQIHSSNTPALAALTLQAGALPLDCGIARDDRQALREVLARASEADIVVSTGGVSVGDFDLVKEVLDEGGLEFWKVRLKPGKPLAFGRLHGRPFFGLPGNPVSCFVNFLEFVRPVIRRSLGDPRPFLPIVDAVLESPLKKAPGREELVRVALRWQDGRIVARSTGGQGSHMLSGLGAAHGLALLGKDVTGRGSGETVAVQIFDASFLDGEVPGYRW